MIRECRLLAAASLIVAMVGPASGEPISFDGSWKEQGFLRLWSNQYSFQGQHLEVTSDDTVSLIWRAVEPSLGEASKARWVWKVRNGVVATDLTQKGGDDRNLAIYFIFVDAETANGLTQKSARRLLRNPNTRALVYVWGGQHSPGSFLPSPYHPRLVTRVLRASGSGEYHEDVDLEADFRTAFGEEKNTLVGIGVSADSDDTDGLIQASIENLELVTSG